MTLRFWSHAQERMKERRITAEDVEQALQNVEAETPARRGTE